MTHSESALVNLPQPATLLRGVFMYNGCDITCKKLYLKIEFSPVLEYFALISSK